MAPKKNDNSGVHINQAVLNPRDKDHQDRPHNLAVAENVLCWDHLNPYIEKFSKLHLDDNMLFSLMLYDLGIPRHMMVVLIRRNALLSFWNQLFLSLLSLLMM